MTATAIDSFVEMVRQRNLKAGIPDYQVIDLGKTSAQKRSRRDWEALQFHTITLVRRMLQYDPVGDESYRATSLAVILCLGLQSTKEYVRITGDIDRAEKAMVLLREMALNALAGGELELVIRADQESLQYYQGHIDSWTQPPDNKDLSAWLRGKGLSALIDDFLISGRAEFSDIKIFGCGLTEINEAFVQHQVERIRREIEEEDGRA